MPPEAITALVAGSLAVIAAAIAAVPKVLDFLTARAARAQEQETVVSASTQVVTDADRQYDRLERWALRVEAQLHESEADRKRMRSALLRHGIDPEETP